MEVISVGLLDDLSNGVSVCLTAALLVVQHQREGSRFLAGSRRTMCLRRRRVDEALGRGGEVWLILSSPYLKGPAAF